MMMMNVYRKDRNSKGGGVMLLIHKDISHMPITELENDSESVWVKVFTNKTSHFVANYGLEQLVHFPTRERNTLDLIITSPIWSVC